MAWDQATAVARWGITDPLKVAMVSTLQGVALSLAESYCNRKFGYAEELARFTHSHAHNLQLERYPIESVVSITDKDGGALSHPYHVIRNTGQIEIDRAYGEHQIIVRYKAGYHTLPQDLELALWLIFDAVWSSTPGAGKAVGAASAGIMGAIKSVETPDAGKITYQDPGAAVGQSDLAGVNSFLTHDVLCLLNPYKRMDS